MKRTNVVRISGIAPIDSISLSPDLNGEHGFNRATANRLQIAAQNDLDAIRAWLARYYDTKTTFDSYRKEAERLLLWAVIEVKKPLSSLTHEDLLMYQRFLEDPQPAGQWVMTGRHKCARDNPDWRPFAGPLSKTSQRQAVVILNAMFAWLVNAGYLVGNPLSLMRQRQRKAKPRVTRFLDEELWQEVKTTVDLMPRETTREREHYYRVRWLFSLFYICGVRISEVTENSMNGFFCRRDNGEERWWLEITGKGDKSRIVPATSELMVELARYRREKGLAPLPLTGETTPLLLPIGTQHRALKRSAVHQIVKEVFEATANRLLKRGPEFKGRAEEIAQASAHWMRHTAATNMTSKAMDLKHVRDNLGHESIATTSKYLHSEDNLRHKETEDKHRLSW